MSSDDSRLYLGAMTGTSVDGLDLALVEFVGGTIKLIAQNTFPLPSALRETLLRLGQGIGDNLDAFGEADAALGRFMGETACGFIASQGLTAQAVRAIGSHGQTVRHRPNNRNAFTLQIGDPNRIAELTGVATVADFRRRDLAAGGQGAPLAPGFHAALFGDSRERRIVLNIGGISNITRLGTPLLGFDTGPGNALMDPWCAKHQGAAFDEGGAWAATGQVDEPLLASLLNDPYLTQAPPKSTGREHYNLNWLNERLEPGLRSEDVQRTLLEMTAASIANAIANWAPEAERIIVCGGGRLNTLLMQRLAALAKAAVDGADEHGWDGNAIEAAAFAWLAHQRLNSTPANVPSVTGASGPRVIGAIYAP
ncbi:MAG: anhydro-N-acetylmuramic acid kinase [Gammaproteobacteria bacterium]|nr:anhydro-N-acetylmuramic acid kinase [Gammaproteobacteria bacterium]